MLLYYITDRKAFAGDESSRRRALLSRIAEAARFAVDLIQLREKDLPARELEKLAREAVQYVLGESSSTRLLVNSRLDVALAAGADGVHLTADDITPAEVRSVLSLTRVSRPLLDIGNSKVESGFLIGASCHTVDELRRAEVQGASFAVLAPIFEKPLTGHPALPGIGTDILSDAARGRLPVFALGGVNLENAAQCLRAGAEGIAGIRLFQGGNLAQTVAALRRLPSAL